MVFAENLRLLRTTNNVSQRVLAEHLKISIKTISHWETGYSEPSISQLIMLADFFDVTVDYLVKRDM